MFFLQGPCVGEEPGTRDLGLRFSQTRVAEAWGCEGTGNHEGKKSSKKWVEGPGGWPAEVEEEGRGMSRGGG